MNKYPVLVCKNCMQIWNYKSDYCPYCYATSEMIVDITDDDNLELQKLQESVAFAETKISGCGIQEFDLTDKEVKNWCEKGCSVDCHKMLKEKYGERGKSNG